MGKDLSPNDLLAALNPKPISILGLQKLQKENAFTPDASWSHVLHMLHS